MLSDKKSCTLLLALFILFHSYAQSKNDTINETNVKDILTFLASDKLKGRVNYSKEQWDAADFIAKKFEEYRLSPFPGFQYYFQPFAPRTDEVLSKNDLKWNGRKLPRQSYLNFSRSLVRPKMGLKDFRVVRVDSITDSTLLLHWSDTVNVIIWIKKTLPDTGILIPASVIVPPITPRNEILIVAAPDEPLNIQMIPNKNFSDEVLYNVVGVLPGKSKATEAIIFSAHYDHVDMDPSGNKVGVFDGANDNASGTTAVLELARYFAMKNDNQRTLIFCLFAGEELGLLGSEKFATDINPGNVKAVINIEMIGKTNSVGKERFFLTGSRLSDLEKIMNKNLQKANLKEISRKGDPGNLFTRSDNYSFYQRGMVAHSIMCSDDNDPCYHQSCDTAERIDFANMTFIINAIVKACQTLVSGEDTPRRS